MRSARRRAQLRETGSSASRLGSGGTGIVRCRPPSVLINLVGPDHASVAAPTATSATSAPRRGVPPRYPETSASDQAAREHARCGRRQGGSNSSATTKPRNSPRRTHGWRAGIQRVDRVRAEGCERPQRAAGGHRCPSPPRDHPLERVRARVPFNRVDGRVAEQRHSAPRNREPTREAGQGRADTWSPHRPETVRTSRRPSAAAPAPVVALRLQEPSRG